MSTSWRSRVVIALLRLTAKRGTITDQKIQQLRGRERFERTMVRLFRVSREVAIEPTNVAGVSGEWLTPQGPPTGKTIIYLHGGGFVYGSARGHRQFTATIATACHARVLALDYSLSPEHPFPTAPRELVTVWQTLVKNKAVDPTKTVFMGDSAGGNIALSAALMLRDAKATLPKCLVLLSPALDATLSGESITSRAKREPMLNLRKLQYFIDAYAQNTPHQDPYLSPNFADLSGLPPFLLMVGSEEMLYSDAMRLMKQAKRDKVTATLYEGVGMFHVWPLFTSYMPEAKTAINNISEYVKMVVS